MGTCLEPFVVPRESLLLMYTVLMYAHFYFINVQVRAGGAIFVLPSRHHVAQILCLSAASHSMHVVKQFITSAILLLLP